MALLKTKTTDFGIEVTDAYNRVENVRLDGKNTIAFSVRAYAPNSSRFFSEVSYFCVYDIAGENPIKQAYEHLKTLPEFAGAADV